MDQYLNIIAGILIETCGDEFDQARVEARLASGFARTNVVCVQGGRETVLVPEGEQIFELGDALHDLRNEMVEDGHELWYGCIFRLKPDHSFDLDLSYDEDVMPSDSL